MLELTVKKKGQYKLRSVDKCDVMLEIKKALKAQIQKSYMYYIVFYKKEVYIHAIDTEPVMSQLLFNGFSLFYCFQNSILTLKTLK